MPNSIDHSHFRAIENIMTLILLSQKNFVGELCRYALQRTHATVLRQYEKKMFFASAK